MSAEPADALSRLRRQLIDAEAQLNRGDLPGAETTCQQAGRDMMQLSLLCQGRPQMQKEAEPLFNRLRVTVDRLQKMQGKFQGSAARQPAASPDAEGSNIADENPFSERVVLQTYQMQQQQLVLMKQRETAMSELAQQMIDLEDIFGKLNELVKEHGEQVQLIEDHVVQVEDHVVSGAEQLRDAVVNKRSSRKKKIIIICAVVAGVIILALVLYFVLSRVL